MARTDTDFLALKALKAIGDFWYIQTIDKEYDKYLICKHFFKFCMGKLFIALLRLSREVVASFVNPRSRKALRNPEANVTCKNKDLNCKYKN